MSNEATEKRYSHIDLILLLLREGKRIYRKIDRSKEIQFKLRVKRAQATKKRLEEQRKHLIDGMNLLKEI